MPNTSVETSLVTNHPIFNTLGKVGMWADNAHHLVVVCNRSKSAAQRWTSNQPPMTLAMVEPEINFHTPYVPRIENYTL